MSTALAILAHALRMLMFDPRQTLRVLMPALVMILGGAVATSLFAPDTLVMLESDSPQAGVPSDMGWFAAFGLISLLGFALLAVLWHRHVLANTENSHLGPALFLGYLWRALLVGVVQVLAILPLMFVLGLLSTGFAPQQGGLAIHAVTLAIGLVFIWIALRISVILPAAAIGYPLTLSQGWATTAPLQGPIWGVALMLTGLNEILFRLTELLVPAGGVTGTLAATVAFTIEGLVLISVLTTLYGHLVEGRSLGQ